VENALLKTREAIREGIPIYKPLESEPVFPPMVTRMIAVGEETGDLDGMLTKIAEFYESEVDATVKALTSIIEPLMIVVVGASWAASSPRCTCRCSRSSSSWSSPGPFLDAWGALCYHLRGLEHARPPEGPRDPGGGLSRHFETDCEARAEDTNHQREG